MPERRLIVVDASLNKRLATELKTRGRDAVSLAELHLDRSKDPVVLRHLTERIQVPWVLVTADDNMPADHADLMAELRTTAATVDRRKPPGTLPDHYSREVVHRWAHVIADQAVGTLSRYSTGSHRKWTLPRAR